MEKEQAREYMRGVRARPGMKEYLADYQSKIRARRIEAGMCVRCGKVPPREGFKACAPCAEKQVTSLTKARLAKPKNDKCFRCENKRQAGQRLCSVCKVEAQEAGEVKRKAREARRRIEAKANGMCASCLCKPRAEGRSQCEECGLKHRLQNYVSMGLTREAFEAMSKTCEVCGSADELHIDHCHDSNVVRGILCESCNLGIGNFRDSKELLFKAMGYLERTTPA